MEFAENMMPLEEIKNISKRDFVKNYLRLSKPVVLKGFASKWRATQDWSIEFFLKQNKNFSVITKKGDHVFNDQVAENMKFLDYLNLITREGNENIERRFPYLTNLDIFSQFPEFKEDVDFSILNDTKWIIYQLCFFGPKGVGTGYHRDNADNLVYQAFGRKRVRMISPKDDNRMYIKERYKHFTKISDVDCFNYDENAHPDFKGVDSYSAILEPGDVLFMPNNWWHAFESLENSISISNWGLNLRDLVMDGFPQEVLKLLHNLRLYKTKDCSCH